MSKTPVRAERTARVLTVTIDRPDVRNAVDGPTAAALAAEFREFDSDETSSARVRISPRWRRTTRGGRTSNLTETRPWGCRACSLGSR